MNRSSSIIQKMAKVSAVYNIYLSNLTDDNQLYAISIDTLKLLGDEFEITKDKEINSMFNKNKPIIPGYFRELLKQREELETIITRNLDKWRLERLNNVVKALLLTAVYDFYNTEREKNVIFNETLEIAKMYLTESEKNFINKILDKIITDKELN